MRDRRVRCAWGAGVLATLLVAAACSEPSGDRGSDPDPDVGPSASASSPVAPADPPPSAVIDPKHAMDPPGPFEPPALSADILIRDDEPITEEVVEAIRSLDGVVEVATLSVGQVVLESRVYDVAAVDPASYRRFTPAASAQLQAQWDRVAAGELAMPTELRPRIPTDGKGFVDLAAEQADAVHVGAYAPQVPTIDLVVNERWGETLELTPRNALLVSTSRTSPQSLRGPVNRIAGAGSATLLDIATQLDLDPDASQSVVLVGTFADAVGVYNYTVSGGRVIPDPAWVREHIVTEAVPILGQVTCNKAMMPQLKAALAGIVARGLADEINPDEYAGCYYPRFIAGSSQLSNHAFGLALDLNVPGNQRGTVGLMDRGVVDEFKKWGFGWGGDWNYTDPMHFELNAIVSPG